MLLKNENPTLPLKASVRSIAVIGPSADDPIALLGNYNGFSPKHVTPLEGIEHQFAAKAKIHYALGATYTTISAALIPSTALDPPSGGGHGLLAEYFDNPEMQGQPKLAHVEPRPFVQAGVPSAGCCGGLSERRIHRSMDAALLNAPVTGDYVITRRGGFGRPPVKIFLDDKELSDSAAHDPGPGRGAPVTLSSPGGKSRLSSAHRISSARTADGIADFMDAAGRGPPGRSRRRSEEF